MNNLVPAVVAGCIREVEERGLNTTGIYRLSGNEKAIHSLINEIDKDPRAVDYKTPVRFKFVNMVICADN